jgi:hypothetical protein
MVEQPLQRARVALLYGPGHLGMDFAAGLLRGIERGLLELGARVRTLNLAFYKRVIRGGDEPYPDDSPLTTGMADFLEECWPAGRVDLCFGLFHDVYLTDRLREVLRRRCATVVNYPLNLLDQPHRFQRSLAFCDQTFCSEEEALDPLGAAFPGKLRYVPMAADPWIFRRLAAPVRPRLLFVGSLYADRLWLLDRCARELPVSIYGSGHDPVSVLRGLGREFLRNRRPTGPVQVARMVGRSLLRDHRLVSDEELVRLAAEHGVSVGFSEVTQERTGLRCHKVRLREYESAMTGLCHLARRLPELERSFEPGAEMLFYERPEQIPELLGRVAAGEIDFRGIGERARARAARDHTWTVRLRAAFS